jgi:hypothetical protein
MPSKANSDATAQPFDGCGEMSEFTRLLTIVSSIVLTLFRADKSYASKRFQTERPTCHGVPKGAETGWIPARWPTEEKIR